jgi:F-type H+-transporting ATPase subunit delta
MPHAISNRYAQALADAAFAPGAAVDPRQISTELHTFIETVRSVSELKNVLLSPAIATGRKRAVVDRLAASLPLSRLVRNFIFVLVDRRRADLLNEIAPAFDAAVDERLGLVRAEVSSAAPLSDAQMTELESALSQVAGRKVRCEYQVDPSLIGGVVARIGSTVYDGSVRSQLNAMRQTLVS